VKENKDYILKTFLELTSTTVPYGYESDFINDMKKSGVFPEFIHEDIHGNYFYKIGSSRTIFTSHIDTVGKDKSNIKHIINGDIISTDGKTILGADDKAGMTIMLYMIKNKIPGMYYFFVGEECGCIGSCMVSKLDNLKNEYDRVISFDRRGINSVITYQSYSRCCSDEFADALSKELNRFGFSYIKDENGIYTDSAEFTDIIPECTNISVGYYNEHTVRETQDIQHLTNLAEACLNVEWEKLPTKRDITQKEYRTYYKDPKVFYNSSYYKNNKHNKHNNVKYPKRTYDYYDDWYDDDYDPTWMGINTQTRNYIEYDKNVLKNWEVKNKKTRRGNKKSKVFFDNGSNTFNVGDQIIFNNKNHYNSVVDAIIDAKLTKEELEIVKDQYFDMSKKEDKELYKFLITNIIV
jgi:hypothetical protein